GGSRVLDDAVGVDGRVLVARGDNGSVTFFDANTLADVGRRFAGNGRISYCGAIVRPLRGLAVSPDGRSLAVGDGDGRASELFVLDLRSHRAKAIVRDRNAAIPDAL